MKILLVCHYFAPEIGAPQARLSEMAKVWAGDGHDVEVLTGMPNHPTGVIHDGYRNRRFMREAKDGYRIIRTWLYATPNEGIARKTLGHLSFMVTGVLQAWRAVIKPDVVVVSSPTFFSILTAWIHSRRFRAPLVVEVRDLWPGIFVELGVLTNKQIIWLLERLELAAYRAASAVVVVTEGFKEDLVRRGVPANKVHVITNGVDTDRFTPGPAVPEVRARLGAAEDDTLALYIGAHGISQGLHSVIEAAGLVDEKVKIAFVGEGADKKRLQQLAAQSGSGNLSFHDGVDRDEVPDLIRSADILLVPLRDIPLFETFIPSKMFEFLAAEKAVIGSVAGEAAAILERAGAMVIQPEDASALTSALNDLAAAPERRAAMAAAGREFVHENYDRTELARRYEGVLAGTMEER
ncbi:MAG: glycosyltransferase family 4 protein [Acidimicrobiales bacterium]